MRLPSQVVPSIEGTSVSLKTPGELNRQVLNLIINMTDEVIGWSSRYCCQDQVLEEGSSAMGQAKQRHSGHLIFLFESSR